MTAGSRGDVAPYTGLAHGLAAAGHEVTLVTHGSFAALAEPAGVAFRALPVDPRAELESARGRGLQRSVTDAGKLLRLSAMARDLVGRMAGPLLAAARESDVLLLSSSLAPLGHAIGTGLGLPTLGVYLQPLAATGEFPPSVLGTPRSLGPAGNRLAGHAVNALVDRIFAGAVRATARELGGPVRHTVRAGSHRARERADWPVLHGYSPLVVPRPADWRNGLRTAGYWWPCDPPEARLPREVEDFLAAGPAPVFVGLGSVTVPDGERLGRLVAGALRRAGLRGIIQRGWARLAAEGPDMLTVGELPHPLLFPRTAAVVHHAGAGTTAAGLRAGVPAVPVPAQFDAGFWAARLTALGVAPAALPLRRLTEPALASALRRATGDAAFASRATALAARLSEEDGIAPVLAHLDGLARGGQAAG
ncbi:glycosyltransferase family 1 protein [Streptomyces sp. HNM0574]|nr:glycosyltransferase family 1 protein [Streptomyces sp. HNM0574]